MPDIVGTCPGCGASNVVLRTPTNKAVVAKGTVDPICRSCEQRVIAKIKSRVDADLRRKGFKQREIEAELAKLDEKVSPQAPVTPTPAAPAS